MKLTEKKLVDLIETWAKRIGIRDKISRISRDNRSRHIMYVIKEEGNKYKLAYNSPDRWDSLEEWIVIGCIFHEFGHIISDIDLYTDSTYIEIARVEEKAERIALKIYNKYIPEMKHIYTDYMKGIIYYLKEELRDDEHYYLTAFERIYGESE